MSKQSIISLLCGVMLVSSAAHAAPANKVAVDKADQVLTNTFGNCVRTKWDAQSDVCAPEAPKPEPVVMTPPPAPAPVIDLDARTLYFEFDNARLTAQSVDKLNNLINILRNSSGVVSAKVIGYADEMGNEGYNRALSSKRASAAKAYLDRYLSIPTQVTVVQGLGESVSVTNCNGVKVREARIACLAADRRVEIEFKYQK